MKVLALVDLEACIDIFQSQHWQWYWAQSHATDYVFRTPDKQLRYQLLQGCLNSFIDSVFTAAVSTRNIELLCFRWCTCYSFWQEQKYLHEVSQAASRAEAEEATKKRFAAVALNQQKPLLILELQIAQICKEKPKIDEEKLKRWKEAAWTHHSLPDTLKKPSLWRSIQPQHILATRPCLESMSNGEIHQLNPWDKMWSIKT